MGSRDAGATSRERAPDDRVTPAARWEGVVMDDREPVVRLERWVGSWADDDPNASFKSDVALYSLVDPLATIGNLSAGVDVPVGAICRYVLAKWASGGSGGLLELGPTMTRRLAEICERAEGAGTDEARVEAFAQLREVISWLRMPLDHPDAYG
jgi:Family of unknown function (DUF6027)